MNALDPGRLASELAPRPAEAAEALRRFGIAADRQGLVEVGFASLETPIGTAIAAATSSGLVRLALPGSRLDTVLEELAATVSPRVVELPRRLDPVRRELDEYFEGRRHRFEFELDWRLTRPGFYRRVLDEAARRLPFGTTASYAEVAAWAGSPRAFRAAGTALATNPLPIVIPCHRVLRSGGGIGLYGGGSEMKERLLRLEGAIRDSA